MSVRSRAEAYDRHIGRYSPQLAASFTRFAQVAPGMRTLDVGCGTGSLAEALARVVGPARVAAIDPASEYVEACRARVSGADVRIGVAEALPFEDGAFDAVLAQLVVQAFDDPPRATLEMRRVAARGATVAACVWDFSGGMPLLDAYWGAAFAVDHDEATRVAGGEDDPLLTPDGLRGLWHRAGLEEVVSGELAVGAG